MKYWFPSILALSLFIFQVYVLGTFYQTLSRFFVRAGLSTAGQVNNTNFLSAFWVHMSRGHGEVATIAFVVGLSVFIVFSSYLISNIIETKNR